MKSDTEKFFCTFGRGQPNAGCALPVIARNESQVREYMADTYNNQWCGTYSEKRWKEMASQFRYYPLEIELPEIDISDDYKEADNE